jgi:trk system potassium uptake protein TrkH
VGTTRIEGSLTIREGYAVVSCTWLAVGGVGALPYLLSGVISDPVAALFESVSGFTTTGSTVFRDIEGLPHGILFWRSLTQWLGGMGIILLGVAILPFLGVGGMHLFRAEVPGPTSERLSPRIAQTAKLLWYVYAGLTTLLFLLLLLGGLGPFDAVNHAFATMPTGGFSTRTESIAAFESPFVQYTLITFMYLAGVNFVLHFQALSGKLKAYLLSAEWRFYTSALAFGMMVVFALVLTSDGSAGMGLERVFRDTLFQAVSLGTGTGFVTFDYGLWPLGAQLILVTLMLMGGMAGSTSGGIKSMRMYVLLRAGISELRRNLHPRAVVVTVMGSKALEESELLNILGFVLLFLGIFFAGVVSLAILGHDLSTSIGASVASIANIGPGLGAVGAVGNYGWMGSASHLVLIALMIVGRLEIFTVLLLFHPDLWRR